MDENTRLKFNIGSYQFEAEGPIEFVTQQADAFFQAIAAVPATTAPLPQVGQPQHEIPARMAASNSDLASTDDALSKIMRVDGRTVSLTVRPRTVEDAVLLILYGQKSLRENDSITGGEVMDGLTATGGLAVERVDRLLEKAGRDGDVIVIGERRAKRYRMTNSGLSKVRQIAADLIATVA